MIRIFQQITQHKVHKQIVLRGLSLSVPKMIPKTRLQVFNKKADSGDFVAYWMIGARRAEWSHSLEHAVDMANEKNLPLVIIEPVFIGQKWANDRFHTFAIQGILDNIESFKAYPVKYIPYIETKAGEADRLLDKFIERAAMIVTDDVSVYYPRTIVEKLTEQNNTRVDVVDGNGFTALRAVPKEFGRAYDFRRHLQKTMKTHLKEFPEPMPLEKATELPKIDQAVIDKMFEAAEALQTSEKYLVRIGTNSGKQLKALKLLDIDHDVPPVAHYPGGTKAAMRCWKEFLGAKINKYDTDRNHPEKNASSYLSPYLHFGHISAHYVVQDIFDKYSWTEKKIREPHDGRREKWWNLPEGVEGFLDQVITWRDVGHLHCALNPDTYDDYSSFSEWSRKTAKDHQSDKRPRIYTFEELENAKTYDDLWNAAQTQLRTDGIIHNYLRMLWGKRVIEWTEDAETAFKYLLDLNDKWALDGRDPNSYCGIGWTLGKFDRGWTERPIYGKIRYMATENTKKKYKTETYIAVYSNSGLKRKTLMKKQKQMLLPFKKEAKSVSPAASPKKVKRERVDSVSDPKQKVKVPKVEPKADV